MAARDLPDAERVADLFTRSGDGTPCPKSTVMFAYFAQWFTDGFLRSDRRVERDPRRNDSRHEIDLLPLYGVTPAWTEQLRAHEGGRLKSQTLGGAEFPPYLYDGGVKKPEFSEIEVVRPDQIPPDRLDTLFAAGSDTTNSQVGFTLLNTLFLREHNRVAGALADAYPGWDDERLFQTARNIMIVLLIKIVIEEYINHITPYHFRLQADPAPFVSERWIRPNWMAIEFNLLYRWHGLIPPLLHGEPVWKTIFNPALRGRARRGGADRRRVAHAREPRRRVQHRPGAAAGRAGVDPRGPRRRARALQRLSRAGLVPARHRLRPDHGRRPARRRRCATSTATSTGSSSSPDCSPRTRARTPSCRR